MNQMGSFWRGPDPVGQPGIDVSGAGPRVRIVQIGEQALQGWQVGTVEVEIRLVHPEHLRPVDATQRECRVGRLDFLIDQVERVAS